MSWLSVLTVSLLQLFGSTSAELHHPSTRQRQAPRRLTNNSTIFDKRSVTGPAIKSDFPDPSLLWDPAEWQFFAYGTTGNGRNVRMATSVDFQTWTTHFDYDPLPNAGSWVANPANVWAPMVAIMPTGVYVLYYSATSASTGSHCIGVATARSARGPFTPQNQPWVCHAESGGSIDAAVHHHPDGRKYVVYKIDGNNAGHGGVCNNGVAPIHSTPIMLQQVSDQDGHTKIGGEIQILDRDAGDGPLVEAPSLIYHGGYWFLFFSSGCFSDTSYDISWATATAVEGPYTKAHGPAAPLLVTGDFGLKAPGSICFDPDASKAVFHAFLGNDISGGRGMFTAIPRWDGPNVYF